MTEGPKNTGEGGAVNGAAEPNEWEIMAQEAAKEAAKENGQNPDEITEDDLEYQKKLAELARRDVNFDPLANEEIAKNETNMGINAKGESYQRMPWNTWDTYARRGKDADRGHFDASNAWHKRIESVMADMEQGTDESSDDFKKRVLDAAYGDVAAEQAADPTRILNQVELDSLRMSYPRQEGESTMAWARRISDETGVRFGTGKGSEAAPKDSIEEEQPLDAPKDETEPNVDDDEFLKQCKSWYERLGDAKSKFEQMDGESDADYERRMNTVVISNMSTEIANNEDRKLNDVEYGKITEMYPRKEDEDNDAYIARVKEETGIDLRTAVATREDMGLDDGGEDSDEDKSFMAPDFVRNAIDQDQNPGTEIIERSAEAEGEDAEAEKARIEKMRSIMGSELFENMRKKYKISDEDLKNMSDEDVMLAFEAYKQQLEEWAKKPVEEGGAGYSDEELRKMAAGGDKNIADLMARFNEYIGKGLETDNNDAESAEQMEKLREAMIRGMSIADLRDMLEAEGVMVDDMENMDAEQLKELQEKLRKRMFEAFGADNGIGDYLERDDIKVDDLEEKDFEGMKDQREVYRQEFIRDLSDETLADKLEARNIRIDDLEAMTMEELLALKKELAAAEKEPEGQTVGGEDGESEKAKDPLIAVMVNRERDAKIAARAMAEDLFQDKLVGDGKRGIRRIVRNLVFGQMLKEATMLKYEREAMEAIENGDNEVRGRQVGEYWSREGDGASGKVVERLTMAYMNGIEDSLLHGAAGNEMDAYGMELDENGNKVVYKYSEGGNKKELVDANSVEAKSTIAVREAIEKFAQGKMSEHDFEEAMKFEKARMADEGLDTSLISDTLLETAKAAKERFNHEESIENVMEGFRLINADYQAQVRTEVHRSKIDEISEKVAGKLHFMQPEVIAAAAGIAVFFTQKATTSALRAAVPVVGGALAAGTFAGFKEHNRVAVDRAEQARRIARGEEIGGTKYDRQMQETEYESFAATDLTATLKKAIESGNTDLIQQGLASVEALTQYSDENKVDLIKFSGGDNTTIEDERLALDVQIAQAKVELRKAGVTDQSKSFLEASRLAYEAIENDVDAKDKAFKKLQAKRVAAQVAKTAAIGVATAVVGQEVSAAFNPDSYGLFDKMNDTLDIRFKPLNIGVNNLDAHKTLLAGFLGINQEQIATTVETITAAEATGAKLTDEQVQQLRNEGYTVNERTVTTTEDITRTETLSAAEYAQQNGVRTSMEWGSNGTRISDGNELAAYQSADGTFYARMSGSSFSGDRSVNFSDVRDNVKLAVSLSGDSQGSRILIDGVVHDDGSVWFPTDDPALSNIIANQEYQAVSVVWDTGEVTSDGARRLFSFASDLGSNSVGEMTQEVTDTIVNTDTVFDVIGFERQATEILQGSDLIKGGVAIPFASRKNLTRGKRGEGHGPSETPNFGGNEPTPPTPPERPENTVSGGNESEPNQPTPPTPPTPPAPGPVSRVGRDIPRPSETQPSEPKPVENGPQPSERQGIEKAPDVPAIEKKDEVDLGQRPSEGQSTESAPEVPAIEKKDEVDLGQQPERNSGDVSPINMTGEQIQQLLGDQENAGVIQARIEYEIDRWNGFSENQRRAFLAGDFSSFRNEEDAEWTKRGIDYLRKYGVLKAPEPADIKMPEIPEEPQFRKATNVEMADGSKMNIDRNGNVTVELSDEALMNKANRFEAITSTDDTRDIMVSDERIAELNPSGAPTEEELRTIRTVLTGWNRMEPEQRQMLLRGEYNATNSSRLNEYLKNNFDILKKFNIIAVPEAGISDEDEAMAA